MMATRPFERLNELLSLPRNWDSYGANPVNPQSVAHARKFGRDLPKGFPLPSIGANPTGHAVLTWYLPGDADELALEFLPTGKVIATQAETETESRFVSTNMRRGLIVLNRFLSGEADE